MSVTITIPAELEQRIAGVAAAQGKNLEEIAIEALEMIFDPAAEIEDSKTLRALENARKGEGRPAREVLEEIRVLSCAPRLRQRRFVH